MQITYPLCTEDRICLGRKHQLKKKKTTQVFSRENWPYLQGCNYAYNFRGLFGSIHVNDLSIHQVFLTENPRGLPHHLGGSLQIGDFFSVSHTITFLYSLCKSFMGEGKAQAKKKKKSRERERGRGVCMTITTSVPLVFVLFMSGNFLAVLPG